MALKRRRFTREFKLQMVQEVEAGKTLVQAAHEYQVQSTLIRRWQKEHLQHAEQAFSGNGNSC